MRASRKSVKNKGMNRVILYSGLPVRYGTMVQHLQEVAQKIAKAEGREDWMALRDAGLMGHSQTERMHPTELPDDVEPLTYEEFKEVMEIPAGSRVPEHILRKWETIYPRGTRVELPVSSRNKPSKQKKTKRATAQAGVRGVRQTKVR